MELSGSGVSTEESTARGECAKMLRQGSALAMRQGEVGARVVLEGSGQGRCAREGARGLDNECSRPGFAAMGQGEEGGLPWSLPE